MRPSAQGLPGAAAVQMTAPQAAVWSQCTHICCAAGSFIALPCNLPLPPLHSLLEGQGRSRQLDGAAQGAHLLRVAPQEQLLEHLLVEPAGRGQPGGSGWRRVEAAARVGASTRTRRRQLERGGLLHCCTRASQPAPGGSLLVARLSALRAARSTPC